MIRKPLQQDSGQVLVLVALLLVVLLGVSAVAVDIGVEIVAVNHLKNMASASALAGATALAQSQNVAEAVVVQAAKDCLTANGVPSAYLATTPVVTSTSVQVSLSEPHSFFLAPILGYSATTINQTATATIGPASVSSASPFNYAIFSDQPLTFTSASYITGGVHCNSTVSLGGLSGSAGSYFTKGIEDIGGAFYNGTLLGGNPVYPNWMNTSGTGTIYAAQTGPFKNNAQYISIEGTNPTTIATNSYNQALAKNHVVTATNWSGPNGTLQPNSAEAWDPSLGYQWTCSTDKNGKVIFSMSGSNPKLLDGPWYFEGNLTVSPGGSLTADGAVVATGQIWLGGGQLLSTGSSGVAFYSLFGSPQYPDSSNIDCIQTHISDTTSKATGTFYAPYGTINLNGGIPIITGSVIGKTVTATNGLTVSYDPNSLSNRLLTDMGPSCAYLTQ